MSNLQINTRVRRLFHYLEDFEKGIIQIPPFQRDFVWNNEKKIELMDSLKNGYPIGTVLFWQPNDSEKDDLIDDEIQNIGSYYLINQKNNFSYILDGYQRLSTLFGCFIDINQSKLKRNEEEWKKNFDILYNLKEDKFEFNRKTKTEIDLFQIPLYHFIEGGRFYDFQTNLMNANFDENEKKMFIQRYRDFGSKISSYDLPCVDLIGGTLQEAVEIFSRLNSRGEKISDYWKVSALSFDRKRNFRFGSEIDELFNDVAHYNYFTKKDDNKTKKDLVLKCVANSFGEVYFDQFSENEYKKLENLCKRKDFIDITRKTIYNIKRTIEFFFRDLHVIDSQLLPYSNQLIFISDFFNKIQNPSQRQLQILSNWFWVTTYSNYFTIYNLSKQRKAYEEFQRFINDENYSPIFFDNKNENFKVLEFPNKIEMGSVRSKALALFMIQNQLKNKKIDASEINGYQTYKLFVDLGENQNRVENTIIILKNEILPLPNLKKGLSEWLKSNEDHTKFFISKEMKKIFQSGAPAGKILEMRRELIIKEEEKFINSLGCKFTLQNIPTPPSISDTY